MEIRRKQMWDGEERRLAERRIAERRKYGRELTNAERDREDRRRGDRRKLLDRRHDELLAARNR